MSLGGLLNKRNDSGLKRKKRKLAHREGKRERERKRREKRNAAGAELRRERIYYIYLMLQYRIFSDIGGGSRQYRRRRCHRRRRRRRVPKNPADRNSKGEAMRNESSELVRVVTRCALLCLGSRAGPSHSLLAALGLSFPSDAERDEDGGQGSERVREHLEKISHQVNALSAQPAGIILKKFCVYIYIYIDTHSRAIARVLASRDNTYCLTAAVLYKASTNDFCRLHSRIFSRAPCGRNISQN